jgi:hypothetical protein
VVVQRITTGSAPTTLIFQWNDPFDGPTGVTTDYDILVFNSAGNYSAHLSGTENNISTNEPLELPVNDMKPFTTYKICIVLTTRMNGTQPQAATRLRYLATDGVDAIIGDYITLSNVSAVGHACAAGAAGVGAYVYDAKPGPTVVAGHVFTPLVDGYSSNGPIEIYFDAAGNRLSTPVIRNEPMFACTDNVDTTFFPPFPTQPNPYDYDNDGFPNFAGTSAAVPHAAGIAALLMNAAKVNNMGTLSPAQIQSILIATTQGLIDEDPIFCSGTAGGVTVTDSGDGDSLPNIFEIALSGTGGKLTSVTLNLAPVGMHFDTGKINGLPFEGDGSTGKPRPVAGKRKYSGGVTGKSSLTIPFTHFGPGGTYRFSIGFDDDDTGLYGYDADELGGATFSATVSGVTVTGTLGNQTGTSYNYKAGYGLLDANAAVTKLLGP